MTKYKTHRFIKYLVFFILLIGPFKRYLLTQGNALIVPGEEVGVLKLGNSIGFIMHDLGNIEPSIMRKIEEGEIKEMWLSYTDLGLTLIFDYATKTLKRIIVLTPGLLVKGTGIHVGSKEAEVLDCFEDPSKDSKANELNYPRLGINFLIKESDRTVSAIEIEARKA